MSLTEKQKKYFTKKAQEFNMSRAEFLRLMRLKAEGEPIIKVEPKCFDDFNDRITSIAAKINNIAHYCNAAQNVHKDDVDNIRESIKEIRKWQEDLEERFNMIDTSIKYANKLIFYDDL